ncbi:MAG: hypothetical protein ACXV4B_08240 [Halobacteriota archaeon]
MEDESTNTDEQLGAPMERWHFYREPDYRGGHSWRWMRQRGEDKLKSRTGFFTFWECVKDAVLAGFDPKALDDHPLGNSTVVEIPKRKKNDS